MLKIGIMYQELFMKHFVESFRNLMKIFNILKRKMVKYQENLKVSENLMKF